MLKAKHGFSFVVATVSVLLLVACGDDNSTKASDKIVVDSVEDLGNCVATKVGNLEYVDTVAYVCVELGDKIKWVQVAGVEDNSEDFRACTGKKDGLYSFSQKENTLYVCNDEEWVPVKQLDDNDSMEESSSSEAKSSSSSVTPQSSSSEKAESSSSKVTDKVGEPVEPAEVTTGTMTDSRDGQTYKTVTIGTQIWMAQNLNYETANSYCYKDSASYCSKYGRLYTWAAAMDSVGSWSTNGKGCGEGTTCSPTYPVRGVCPEGWHLPTEAEFETLFTVVGGKLTAGKVLKSTTGWTTYSGITNEDAFAFSALPAGFRDGSGVYFREGDDAYFWSSTEYYMFLSCSDGAAYLGSLDKYYGVSVRCLKDESSSKVTEPAEVTTGTMTDSRDGQTYKTVTIGTQTWMAENLNYETENSYCYKDSASYCTKYGRLYTWAAAMDSVGTWSTNGKGCGFGTTCSPTYPVRGVCPEGWHLPTKAEFETLFSAVGGQSTIVGKSIAGKVLKSTTGWTTYSGITNEDAFAFSALPAGFRDYVGTYNDEGAGAYFWSSSTWYISDGAYGMDLYYDRDVAYLGSLDKYYGVSVRCLKD